MRVQVIGAGVNGLTCALVLARAGHEVEVSARARTPHTTSDLAGGLVFPFLAHPMDQVLAWMRASLRAFGSLPAEAGAQWVTITEHLDGPPAEDQPIKALPDVRAATPAPGYSHALCARTILVDMSRYMPWLQAQVAKEGVTIREEHVMHFPDDRVVVNCAGLGARELAGDDTVRPVQGQLLYVEDEGLQGCHIDQRIESLAYVFPFGDRVVLGGTAVMDAHDTVPRGGVTQQIRARASILEPRVAGAREIKSAVGLRPFRPTVRVEREGHVVHNYGHGGSGVTLSWGCAQDVLRLLER